MTLDLLIANTTTVGGLMLAVWLVSLPLRNVGIVDAAWGLGFVLVAWTTVANLPMVAAGGRWPLGALLLPALVTIWGLRLAGHLGWRNIGSVEDSRYAALRDSWPWFAVTSLGIVFGLQGAIMLVVSLPVQAGIAANGPAGWTPLHVVGTALWAVGLFFEVVGDWQLVRFKSRPENEGRVLDDGLWRYTRHPNYFGDFLVWWGLFLVAIASGAAWWTVVGPLLMSYLLLRVSGVTLLEKGLRDRKPAYAEYVRRTNAFFPGPPRPATSIPDSTSESASGATP